MQMVLVGVGSTAVLRAFWVGRLWAKSRGAPSPSSPCMQQEMLLAVGRGGEELSSEDPLEVDLDVLALWPFSDGPGWPP